MVRWNRPYVYPYFAQNQARINVQCKVDVPISSLTERSPFRFLDLPKDVRFMVYDLALICERIYHKTGKRAKHYAPRLAGDGKRWPTGPQVQLFRTCKEILKEARSLYLANNIFALPGSLPPKFSSLMSDKDAECVRALSMSLDKAELDLNIAVDLTDDHWSYLRGIFSDSDIVKSGHRQATDISKDQWFNKFQPLASSLSVRNLRYLEIDVSAATCVFGCHRLHEDAFEAFAFLSINGVVEIVGHQEEQVQTDIAFTISDSHERQCACDSLHYERCPSFENEQGPNIYVNHDTGGAGPLLLHFRSDEDEGFWDWRAPVVRFVGTRLAGKLVEMKCKPFDYEIRPNYSVPTIAEDVEEMEWDLHDCVLTSMKDSIHYDPLWIPPHHLYPRLSSATTRRKSG